MSINENNDKFSGYIPKMNKPSEKKGNIHSGAEKGNTYEDLGNDLDKLNPYEFRKGMDYELVAIGCMRLKESTPEEREKASEKVINNLNEHPSYYSSLIQYETEYRNKENKPTFKTWLKEFDEEYKMKEIDQNYSYKHTQLSKSDKMEELKEAIKKEIMSVLKEQNDKPEVDLDDDEKSDKSATKAAKKTKMKSGNRFDAEKEAIKDLLYRGKKGNESDHTEDDPAPESILSKKDEMLDTYKTKFKGKEGGADDYNDLLKKANEKFLKILEKHVKTFGEEGKGNKVTLDKIYGERLPDTIKLLGARLKEIEKEEEAEVISKSSERRKIAETNMSRSQHIKLLEICSEYGVNLKEGASSVKMYYEIAKAAYLEGVADAHKL